MLQLLDLGADVMRPDRRQRQAAFLAPGEEPAAGPGVGPARVRVADVGGEELDIAPAAASPTSAISAGTTAHFGARWSMTISACGIVAGSRAIGWSEIGPPTRINSWLIKVLIMRDGDRQGRGLRYRVWFGSGPIGIQTRSDHPSN